MADTILSKNRVHLGNGTVNLLNTKPPIQWVIRPVIPLGSAIIPRRDVGYDLLRGLALRNLRPDAKLKSLLPICLQRASFSWDKIIATSVDFVPLIDSFVNWGITINQYFSTSSAWNH